MPAYRKPALVLLSSLFLLACDKEELPVACESADQCTAPESWPGLFAGHVDYERGYGYRFTGIGGDRIYRRPDASAEGGFRFYDDQSDEEILIVVPESMNVGHSISGQYDFRLTSSLLGSTSYELFSPADVLPGALPDLRGDSLASYLELEDGWGVPGSVIPFLAGTDLMPGDAIDLAESVWSSTSVNNDQRYLLIRQAITIGEGGVLRPGDAIALEGIADRDVSVFLRTPSGDLVSLYEGEATRQDLLRASLVPYDLLEPGTNYLEIYASTGVATPIDRPPFEEGFDSYDVGDDATELGSDGYTTAAAGTWLISSFDGVPLAVVDPGAPASSGNLLYQSENIDSYIALPDPTRSDFPDQSLELTLGVPALDNDLVTVWIRHDLVGITPADQTGYFFFLRGLGGLGPDELSTAQAGLAMRTPDGTITLLTSDLDGGLLSTWVAAHGVRNNVAEHWNLRVEAVGDRITVDISERGTRLAAAPAPSLRVVDLVDTTFESGDLALAMESQSAWFDNISIDGVGLRAGLRVDVGETSAKGIQSLDALITLPRYYVEDNTVYDRLGDGTKETNANPFMTSDAQENWIDYVPLKPLALGVAEDLSCKCAEAIRP